MEVDAISDYMSSLRHSLGKEDAENMIVSLKVDKDTEMGLVSDVKQALRRAHVMRVHYSAVSKDKNL